MINLRFCNLHKAIEFVNFLPILKNIILFFGNAATNCLYISNRFCDGVPINNMSISLSFVGLIIGKREYPGKAGKSNQCKPKTFTPYFSFNILAVISL